MPPPSPTYDLNGNQKNLTATGESISWNALNQPISMNGVTATYDALGRMVETGSGSAYQQFVFRPSGALLAIYNAGTSTLVKGTVPLPGGDTAIYNASGLSYLRHTDWLGSSRLATTWAHAVYSKEAYAPFGETYNEAGVADRSFTGQDQDVVTGSGGTGVYDFLYRKHDPSAGRWLSPDPYGWNAVNLTNPQTLNRYGYVGNMPMSNVDPAGLDMVCYGIGAEGGYYLTCYDTGTTVVVTPDGPDENPEQNPGDCINFGECLQYTSGDPGESFSFFGQNRGAYLSHNPCSAADPAKLDYSQNIFGSKNSQQHILQNHTGNGKGPSLYAGDWVAIKTLNGSTLMYGYPAPAADQSSGSITLLWAVPQPLSFLGINNYIGKDANGNLSYTNKLVVLDNCTTVVTSYPVSN